MDDFAQRLLAWHDTHGRKDLPWQQDINAYRVWISEIMLQQTQVATVIDYYHRFMQRFPNVTLLANAPLDDVLHLWTGLGYYARARNLHKAAQQVVSDHQGELPDEQAALEALPGIGRSTAGAIRAIAYKQHAPILDGNVKRVLARYHAITGYPGTTANQRTLWDLATGHTPAERTDTYTQAIMDLGATVCRRRAPDCTTCPVASGCQALATNQVDNLPAAKPKKTKPVRQARFFVVVGEQHHVLLERKPLEGLWGGLWTPPERAAEMSVQDMCTELGVHATDLERTHTAPVFRHTFTHFHLMIEPVYIYLQRLPSLVADADDRRWVPINQVRGSNNPIGLSAPAVKLMQSLQEPFEHA